MDLANSEYYLNRELALLQFQDRVLREGLDRRNPLLERVKMLYYFTKNTDEFFMKRIGMLKHEMEAAVTTPTVDGLTPAQQWGEAMKVFRGQLARQYRAWKKDLEPALADRGIRIVSLGELSKTERRGLRERFENAILPTLTPLAFDPAHPFPFISNLSLSIGMYVKRRRGGDGEPVFTRVKVPPNQHPYCVVRESETEWVAVPLAEVITANLDLLLPEAEVTEVALFRVTRSAEVEYDEDVANDLLDLVQDVLEKRRQAPAVRLEVEVMMSQPMRSLLLERLGLKESELITHQELVDYLGFEKLADLERPDLKYPVWTPQPHPWLPDFEHEDERDMFSELGSREVLVHHPYHSFAQTTQRFLDRAADDPNVLGIKIAIYRTDNDSKVLDALMRAARNGKQVAVLVELKARFDEHHNVRWVRRLEDQGIHVAYGKQDHKTHTKLALVIREEPDGVRLYSHVGTGNYHGQTAKGYTDLGLLTADDAVGRDVVTVFNIFTGPHNAAPFKRMLIAPIRMRDVFLERVATEAKSARKGKPARIIAKMNALEDVDMVRALYEAARAGVEIDLVVRDICRLRPQVKGLSETVRVHSVVGRFLEHSRIFYFANHGGNDGPAWYIGSADWMRRNLSNRMEAAVPIRPPVLQRELRVVLETMLADNRRRWSMQEDGTYKQRTPAKGMPELDSQQILMERAQAGVFGEHGSREAEILKRQPAPRPRVAGE